MISQNRVPSPLVSNHSSLRKTYWRTSILGALLTNGNESGSKKKKESPEIKLQKNEDGYPILPSLEEIDPHSLEYKKKLIGKFMGDVYGS